MGDTTPRFEFTRSHRTVEQVSRSIYPKKGELQEKNAKFVAIIDGQQGGRAAIKTEERKGNLTTEDTEDTKNENFV